MLGQRPLLLAASPLLAIIALAGTRGVAQRSASPPLHAAVATQAPVDSAARSAAIGVARDIMLAARYCALITQDANSGSAARTIDPAPPDSAMVVRFVTNPRSRKVRQIASDPRVTLYYFDAKSLRYAALSGRARVVRDSAERRRLWHDAWTPFYPGREREATLFVVIPERLEVVSPSDGITGDSITWAPTVVRFPQRRRTH